MHRTKRFSPAGFLLFLLGLVPALLLVPGLGAERAQAQPPRPEGGPASAGPMPRSQGRTPAGNVLPVPLGGNKRLQMKNKQVIDTVVNDKDNVAMVTPVPGDPTTVNVSGKEAGVTYLTLTGADRSVERYEVVVQLDTDYLRSVLERTVPASNLDLIPAGAGAVTISGTVTHADDIDVVLRIAAGMLGGPDRVINAMRQVGPVQVQLDVVIATVSRTDARSLQDNFFAQGTNVTFSGPIALPLGPAVANSPPNTNIFTSITSGPNVFSIFLQALRAEGVAKILAEPRLVTLSGRSATFVAGGDQAVPVLSGSGGSSVAGIQFEPFGVRLSFLPIVLGDGKIHLEVEAENSALSNNPAASAPIPGAAGVVSGRTTDRVHTTVIMEDGQTFSLSGLIQHSVNTNTSKVPVLGDIPFLGVFFSSKTFNEEEDEVLIVVTPHLVDAMSCVQKPKLFPGQETRNPDDFELFLEGILEAPRGSREVFQGNRYVPAWKNSPTAGTFPCSGPDCGGAGCGVPGPADFHSNLLGSGVAPVGFEAQAMPSAANSVSAMVSPTAPSMPGAFNSMPPAAAPAQGSSPGTPQSLPPVSGLTGQAPMGQRDGKSWPNPADRSPMVIPAAGRPMTGTDPATGASGW